MTPVAIYVHTPFCPSKCGYCDFNSYAMTGDIIDRTIEGIRQEILRSPWRGRPAKTIFFGGGTPTFLTADQLCGLLAAVMEVHPPVADCEITSEANPGTVDMPKFAAMHEAGFNRISLGAQSFHREDLIRLGRVHEASHVAQAVGAARRAGFQNVNVDLMFALPGQSLAAWEANLDLALGLGTEHLSLYCLTIEPNTRYYKLHLRGMLDLPDDEVQVAMYDQAVARCSAAGLDLYEISNFAKPGRECEHNRCYWRGEEYLAYGPGAVGCYALNESTKQRYTNMKHPERYLDSAEPWCESEVLDESTQATERIMLGLRMREGVDATPLDSGAMARLEQRGWIWRAENRIGLTPQGRHFCSEAVSELI